MCNFVTERNCTLLSPQNLKSLDLYEEIITQEQQDREASYNEVCTTIVLQFVCTCFVLILKNTTLNTENSRLKKNICALIKTAKMEVVRKDEEINRLNRRLVSSFFFFIHLPPLPDEMALRPSVPVTSKTPRGDSDRDVVQPPLPPPPSDATVFRPPLPDEMVLRPPVPVTPKTPRGDSESPAPDIDSSVSFNKESVNRIPLCELRSSGEHKRTKNSEVRGQNTRPSEQWHKNSSVVNKESHSNERNRSHRAQKDSGKHGSKSGKSRDCSSDVALDRRSERASNILHCTSSSDRTSKGLSKDNPDIQSIGSCRHDKELMHEKEDIRHSRSEKYISFRNRRHGCLNQGSLTERSSKSLNHKGGTSSTRDHQRKEERREGEIGKEKNRSGERSKRKSTSERGKEHERNRTLEGNPSSMNFTKDKNMDNSKVGEQQTQEECTVLLAKATLPEKSSVEENSPNRKLCFMETLNLTLSPVKKPNHLNSDKALAETIVATEQLKCHLEVVDSTVQDGSENRPALLEATVDLRTEPTKQQPLTNDFDSFPDCDSVVKTTLKSRMENWDSENKSNISEELTDAAVASTTFFKNCVSNSNVDISSNRLTPEHSNGDSGDVINSCVNVQSDHATPSALQLPVSIISNSNLENGLTEEAQVVSMDAVSSTRCVESIPEICITSDVTTDVTEITVQCEEEKTTVGLNSSFHSKPSYRENEEENVEPSSSLLMAHDEDSMMLTLRSLKVIPNPISPLTSPVRPTRKCLQACQNEHTHIKSLSKAMNMLSLTEFSSAAGDPDSNKVEVNNENKNTGGSLTTATQQDGAGTPDHLSSQEEELEEGEIVSESEGDEKTVTRSSLAKTVRPTGTVQNQLSPKSLPSLSRHASKDDDVVTQGHSKARTRNLAPPIASPTSNKTRYKIIQPPLPKAPLSTVEEVMDIFAKIRFECRKKYFKFHSVFSKKAFSSLMGMSLDSFTEFVDSICFTKLCSQEDVLKVNLKNMLMVVLNKLADNGIVNRLFDQQPINMKSKIWEFVDVQLDFLFLEIQTALRSVLSTATKLKREQGAVQKTECLTKTIRHKRPQEELSECVEPNMKRSRSQTEPPCKTGLGRGKNIRMSSEEEDKDLEPQTSDQSHVQLPLQQRVEILPSNTTSSAEKTAAYVRRLSQNGSFHDKSDFEILTEQQASSLTFNLVTDSQMGEIFKCLLQGSDLLETNISAAESQGWPLGTPRKEGERFLGVTTPSKLVTPSKLIATWSAISPQKFSSPNSKIQVPVNPASLDESCMLEVPSGLLESGIAPESSVFSQRSFSILAEDLAVSLTIPSPLKSDNHLSFLRPASGEALSAPDSVISAHFSEDALMDGEDATEQDIHLALDTDNSSGASSAGSKTREPSINPLFHFKPHLPMRAVVTEKSNDHFIVRIRHADVDSACSGVNCTSLGSNSSSSGDDLAKPGINCTGEPPFLHPCPSTSTETASELSEPCLSIAEDLPERDHSSEKTGKKRTKHFVETKAKRAKKDVIPEKSKHKSPKGKRHRNSKRERKVSSSPESTPSPNSLSAKNIIKKKGEVIVTWTRDEDRDILLALKMKGASRDTFSALSEKMKKTPAQISERFSQLMKLFKKKEKMTS
uniref:Caspase 8 associated protein 2 n=1 Tax=Esox lucius TaxID=8010 RepID=A0A3P9AAR1_ESOLU